MVFYLSPYTHMSNSLYMPSSGITCHTFFHLYFIAKSFSKMFALLWLFQQPSSRASSSYIFLIIGIGKAFNLDQYESEVTSHCLNFPFSDY